MKPRLGAPTTATLRSSLAAFAMLACPPDFAQTTCQSPPSGMSCPGDKLVWCNTPSHIYHFQGERYFGCTKTGEFLCQKEAESKGCRPTHNGQVASPNSRPSLQSTLPLRPR
jgi:hypothetical protein